MTFKLEKVANMVFLVGDEDIIFKAWDETDFTERKFKNAMKKIQGNFQYEVTCIREF